MPLSMVGIGNEMMISKINGTAEIKTFLENLGFVTGSPVKVLSEAFGNLIVAIKDSKIAISKKTAESILVSERRDSGENIEG